MKIVLYFFILFCSRGLFAQEDYSCYVDINVKWIEGQKSKIRLTNKYVPGRNDTGVLLERNGAFDYVESEWSTRDLQTYHRYFIDQDDTEIFQLQHGTDYHKYSFITKKWWSPSPTPYARVILNRHMDSDGDDCFENRQNTEYIPNKGEFTLIIQKNGTYHYPFHYCVKCPL